MALSFFFCFDLSSLSFEFAVVVRCCLFLRALSFCLALASLWGHADSRGRGRKDREGSEKKKRKTADSHKRTKNRHEGPTCFSAFEVFPCAHAQVDLTGATGADDDRHAPNARLFFLIGAQKKDSMALANEMPGRGRK